MLLAIYQTFTHLSTGKDLETHDDVKQWHYFINEIYFSEYGENNYLPYTVTNNVIEKADGSFVYSYNAEKEFTMQPILHSDADAFEKGENGELYMKATTPSIESQEILSDRTTGEDVNENFSERGAEYSKPITTNDVKVLREITKAHNGERVSINDFTSADIQKAQKWAYKFYKELGTKSPFFRAWFGDYRQYEDNPETDAIVIRYGYGEHFPINTAPRTIKNDDTGFEINIDNDIVGDSLHYASMYGGKKQTNQVLGRIDEIVKHAILLDTQISDKTNNNKKSSTSFMHYLYAPITINNAPFLVKLTVEEYGINSTKRGYNVKRIKMSALQTAQFSKMIRKSGQTGSSAVDGVSISQLYSLVKQFDKAFHAGKPVHPALLNEDGTPRIFYHGTPTENGEFYVFDETLAKKRGGLGIRAYGKGNYFTTRKLTKQDRYGQGRIISAYIHLSNPLVIDG